jgi:hypothetical protein
MQILAETPNAKLDQKLTLLRGWHKPPFVDQ